jgi:hypothetical protein
MCERNRIGYVEPEKNVYENVFWLTFSIFLIFISRLACFSPLYFCFFPFALLSIWSTFQFALLSIWFTFQFPPLSIWSTFSLPHFPFGLLFSLPHFPFGLLFSLPHFPFGLLFSLPHFYVWFTFHLTYYSVVTFRIALDVWLTYFLFAPLFDLRVTFFPHPPTPLGLYIMLIQWMMILICCMDGNWFNKYFDKEFLPCCHCLDFPSQCEVWDAF